MDNREANLSPHKEACTCVECTQRRLERTLGKKASREFRTVPGREEHHRSTEGEAKAAAKAPQQESSEGSGNRAHRRAHAGGRYSGGYGGSGGGHRVLVPDWLKALLLVFALLVLGLATTPLLSGHLYVFWMLLGFGSIFAIEKWLSRYTLRPRLLGRLYKLGLNLTILSALGFVIWSAVELFSHHFLSTPVTGTVVFLGALVFFIWLWRVVSRNSWRKPSMRLTAFSLVVLCLVLAFAGVQPLGSYKDRALTAVDGSLSGLHTTHALVQSSVPHTVVPVPQPSEASQSSSNPFSSIVGQVGSWLNGTTYNPNAVNPSWAQLVNFLRTDDTDQQPYVYPSFVCENFARMLQDHAEKAGWRCAIVDIQLSGYPDFYHYGIPSDSGHALNAFQTTDRGLVYIDATGQPAGVPHPSKMVATVDVEVGKPYIPVSIFPEAGWDSTDLSMGTVTSIDSTTW